MALAAAFLSELKLDEVDDRYYRLTEPLIFRPGDGIEIIVPKGYITDLATIPWWVQWLIPHRGKWDEAAVIHDWLYTQRMVHRLTADALFLAVMQHRGVATWRRMGMFGAVRLFGGAYRDVG